MMYLRCLCFLVILQASEMKRMVFQRTLDLVDIKMMRGKIDHLDVADYPACSLQCLKHPECISFTFRENTGRCKKCSDLTMKTGPIKVLPNLLEKTGPRLPVLSKSWSDSLLHDKSFTNRQEGNGVSEEGAVYMTVHSDYNKGIPPTKAVLSTTTATTTTTTDITSTT